MNACDWKENWNETRQHFTGWWQRKDLVVVTGARPASTPHARIPDPGVPAAAGDRYRDASWRARHAHHHLSRLEFPCDTLPIAQTDIGPGSLALFLGAEPGFTDETVWFKPCWRDVEHPDRLPPLRFDPKNHWWRLTEATCRACADQARGHYLVGCPDLIENIDILAALRDPQLLMTDMIERPDWVAARVEEINAVFFEAYQRLYEIIQLPDGSATFGAFQVWGPGKTAKVQCDAAAMFSPDMFGRFVVPSLARQCEWLDYSLFHLDGTHCINHLDHLLGIDALDAIEWTPQAGIEGGGHPRWFDLYRRIRSGGKALQVVGVRPDQVAPLLDAVGPEGVFILCHTHGTEDIDAVLRIVERYR